MSATTRLDHPEFDASPGGPAPARPAREPAPAPIPLGTPRGVARMLASPGGGSALRAALLGLQRTAGNDATQRIVAASAAPTVQREPFDEEQTESRAPESPSESPAPASESRPPSPLDEGKSEPGVEKPGETPEEKFYRLVYEMEYAAALSLVIKTSGLGGKNVASITYDPGLVGKDGLTDSKPCPGKHPGHAVGAKGLGPDHPQFITIGPSAFTYPSYCASVIGHEIQHVQQRTQEKPIEDPALKEFLAYSWQVLGPAASLLSKDDLRANAYQARAAYQAIQPARDPEEPDPKVMQTDRMNEVQSLLDQLGPAPGVYELAELQERLSKGKISQEEFEAQKETILARAPSGPVPSWPPATP